MKNELTFYGSFMENAILPPLVAELDNPKLHPMGAEIGRGDEEKIRK